MADLDGIVREINNAKFVNPVDKVRISKIRNLSKYTGRNIICYYSGFIDNPDNPDVAINEKDINGLMTAIHGLDKSRGLDLIIHSPGGSVDATEAVGDYLKSAFDNDIRVIVPQIAMSGGTMLACIGLSIVMGRHSSIGPIDPQVRGVSAYDVIKQFEEAKKEIINNPPSIPYWQPILGGYQPYLIKTCQNAVELSGKILTKWLMDGKMFANIYNKNETITKIVNYLNNNEHTKIHSRHINAKKAKEIGLRVEMLEEDQRFQDCVLSVHHSYMITFQLTRAVKIIENQNGKNNTILSQDK